MSENEQKDFDQNQQRQDDAEMQSQEREQNTQNTMITAPKNSQKFVAVICIAAFFLLFADLIAATVLVINGIYIGAIVCAAIFGGSIISAIVAVIIKQIIAMRNDIRTAKKITNGKVTRCVMSNMTEYSIEVIVDGKEYVVSSKDSYEPDDEVMIAIFSKKRARIVADEKELENLNKPIVPNVSMHRNHYRPRHRH
ncbi:MAG: hypothetical protein K2M75_04105 [Clostridia bacterium]|nr:hypothetical protein [Clostridia bacterium]